MNHIETFQRPRHRYSWLPVFFGLAVIACESTRAMGAHTTDSWLLSLINLVAPHDYSPAIEEINQALRKSGHFLGYGLLGVVFARAAFAGLRRKLTARYSVTRLYATLCGIASVLLIASADEIHQMYLPGRGASVIDVCIDTAGALTLNLLYLTFVLSRRRRLISRRVTQRVQSHFNAQIARLAVARVNATSRMRTNKRTFDIAA